MSNQHQAQITDHPDFRRYDFGQYHPLRPERIDAGLALLLDSGLWRREGELLLPVPAEIDELELVHAPSYIHAVEEAGSGRASRQALLEFGLSSTDNPPFADMHYAASLVAGGAISAVRAVMSGTLDHAFHPAGGLHHAWRARASGFCIYNDPALAAAIAAREYGARVLSIDLDCHHGDGVQWIFYRDPRVFTLSFHESGEFLFPGTGAMAEIGSDEGSGFCLNLPFHPFTMDGSWRNALDTILPAIVDRFRPDLIISNHGCDTHQWDPLTHLSLTTDSFRHQARLVHELAHGYCGGRWLAVGSGGYDWRRVVPRSWAIIWAEMTGRALPDMLPDDWTQVWLAEVRDEVPDRFLDDPSVAGGSEHGDDIARLNAAMVDAAQQRVNGLRT